MTNEPTSGLIDIIEPVAPAIVAQPSPLWPLLVLGVLLVLAAAGWWRARRPQRSRIKRVRQLRRAMLAGEASGHEAAYRLALELRAGLRMRRLAAAAPPVACTEPARWAELVAQLDALRYQPEAALDGTHWAALFAYTETCLRRAPRC